MNSESDQYLSWRTAAILLIVLSAFYWLGNGKISLFDRDEPRFAQPAKEMLFAQNWKGWIVPHFNGEPFFHKPPLCYWQIALADLVFGINEFSARFFSGLWTALAAVILAVYLAKRFSKLTGLLAVIAFSTSLMVIVQAKMAIADATLNLLTILSVLSLWEIYNGSATLGNRLILWTAVGVAILCKGHAVFVVIPGLTITLLILDRNRKWVRQTGFWWGLPLALAIGLPWYFLANHLAAGLVERFIKYDLVARAKMPLESHWGFPGYYILTAIFDTWPWSAFLAPVAIFTWKNRTDKNVKFLLAWLIGPTVILECIKTKLPHYWLIVLPAYIILLALAAESWITDPENKIWKKWNKPVLLTISGVWTLIAAGGLAGFFYIHSKGTLISPIFLTIPVVFFASAAIVYFTARGKSKSLSLAFSMIALAVVLSISTLSVFILPALEKFKTGKNLAVFLKSLASDNTTYVLIGWQEPSTVFYLNSRHNIINAPVKDFWSYTSRPDTIVAIADKYAHPLVDNQSEFAKRNLDLFEYTGPNYTRGGRPITFYIACSSP
ncbi:MAG: glycosyltransferase family 39 protein [Phycisphaerae bacterium]